MCELDFAQPVHLYKQGIVPLTRHGADGLPLVRPLHVFNLLGSQSHRRQVAPALQVWHQGGLAVSGQMREICACVAFIV